MRQETDEEEGDMIIQAQVIFMLVEVHLTQKPVVEL